MSHEKLKSINTANLAIVLRRRDLFSETYCGGYSGEDPPLPIPNREVKLTIADGTAPPGGRVGSCHALTRSFETTVSELFLCVSACGPEQRDTAWSVKVLSLRGLALYPAFPDRQDTGACV